MPPQHDAFGRLTDAPDSPFPSPDPERRPARVRVGRPSAPRDPRRPAWRLPYLAVLLLVGAGGVTLTLSAAADWAADQPATHEFALERDPFGPRSLLRSEPLQRAIDIGLAEATSDERVATLNVTPIRLLVTLTDARDQSRWVFVDTADEVRTSNLRTSAYPSTVSVEAVADVDPAPAARAMLRRWNALRPYGRDPSMSLRFDADRDRVAGWSLSVDGVRQDDRTVSIGTDGKALR